MRLYTSFGALGLIIILFLFFSCGIPVVDTFSTESDRSVGSLLLNFSNNARTITPSNPDDYTITSYSVSGSGPGGATFTSEVITDSYYTNTELDIGTWTITIQGLNYGGHVIAGKTIYIPIEEDTVATTIVDLVRNAGNGTLSLTFNWIGESGYDEISGSLTNENGSSSFISLTISDNKAIFTGTLEAGNYTLDLKLRKSSIVLDSLIEAVQVYAGYTSSATYLKETSGITDMFNYSESSPVYSVDFEGQSSKSVIISGAIGRQVYLVKANQSTSIISANSTGSASSDRELIPYSKNLSNPEPVYQPSAKPVVRVEHEEAAAFNADPLPITTDFKSLSLSGISLSESTTYGIENPLLTLDSSTKMFWVEDALYNWIQVPATLRAIGEFCYIWVVNSNYDNVSTLNNDNHITTLQANALRDKFDGTMANSYQDGIFKNVSNIFGYEYGGGAVGSGGRDGDQHIEILIYDIDEDFTSNQTGGVLGYFWGKDFYSQAEMNAAGSTIRTNYSEIFYIDSHFTDRYSNMIVSTLAHEYQHMINFNEKYVERGLNSPTWYNEMCSMVAEDLIIANIGLDPVTDGSQDRLNEFLYHYAESGVTDWLSGSNSLKSYASAFAFGAYLARNYGGATFFKNLSSNSFTGEASISNALAVGGYSDTFNDTFEHYGEAILYTDKPAGSSVKTFNQVVTDIVGTISYTVSAINFDAIQQYNLASGSVSGAYGPRIFDPEDTTVGLRPYGNSIHSKPSWSGLTGSLELSLIAPADSNVHYYLMVK